MQSMTMSESTSFTLTHAKYLASKVATDLKRMQRMYGLPTDVAIASYEIELTLMLKAGYLGTVIYGYQRDGQWIEPMLRYNAKDLLTSSGTDDDPGAIRARGNIEGAVFKSYLTNSALWSTLGQAERDAFELTLPFSRNGVAEPGVNGVLIEDKTYSSGSRSLSRATLRSF